MLGDPQIPCLILVVVDVRLGWLDLMVDGQIEYILQIVVEDIDLFDVDELLIVRQVERQRNIVVEMRERDLAVGDLEPTLVILHGTEVTSALEPRWLRVGISVFPETEE